MFCSVWHFRTQVHFVWSRLQCCFCSFAVSGTSSWNSLPESFRDTNTPRQFQHRVKTLLFHLAYRRDLTAHLWLSELLERRIINVRTELTAVMSFSKTTSVSMSHSQTLDHLVSVTMGVNVNEGFAAVSLYLHAFQNVSRVCKDGNFFPFCQIPVCEIMLRFGLRVKRK